MKKSGNKLSSAEITRRLEQLAGRMAKYQTIAPSEVAWLIETLMDGMIKNLALTGEVEWYVTQIRKMEKFEPCDLSDYKNDGLDYPTHTRVVYHLEGDR